MMDHTPLRVFVRTLNIYYCYLVKSNYWYIIYVLFTKTIIPLALMASESIAHEAF